MKYTARGHGRHWHLDGASEEYITFDMEAEASISAWALSMIAAGRRLHASPFPEEITLDSGTGRMTYEFIQYDGPTKGVAP